MSDVLPAMIKIIVKTTVKLALLYIVTNVGVRAFAPQLIHHFPVDITRFNLSKHLFVLAGDDKLPHGNRIPDHSVIELSMPVPGSQQTNQDTPSPEPASKERPAPIKERPDAPRVGRTYIGKGDVPMGQPKTGDDSAKTIYQYRDANGVLHFTDEPAQEHKDKAKPVTILPNANVVPSTSLLPPEEPTETNQRKEPLSDDGALLSLDPIKKALDARNKMNKKLKKQKQILEKEL